MERCVARLLRHRGFDDVQLVGGAGEQGADVVATKNNERWVFQVKYKQAGAVDKKAVSEVFNAYKSYEAKYGVVVTNVTFGPAAQSYRDKLKNEGWHIDLWDKNTLLRIGTDYLEEIPATRKAPYPYQQKAINAILESINSGEQSGLVTLATGLGKTLVGASVVREYLASSPSSKILVMAHMNELVKQLEQSFWSQLDKYVDTHIWAEGEKPSYLSGITFATWQSIQAQIRTGSGDLKNKFDLIMVDEAHHAPSEYFKSTIAYLSPKYLLGVTATPWRSDKEDIRSLFGETKFSMSLVEGMHEGYLSEVDYEMLTDGIDWKKVEAESKKGLTIKDLNKLLFVPERDNALTEKVVDAMKKIENPRVLVFCPTIKYAERLESFFQSFGQTAATIHSKLHRTERFKRLSNFRSGKLKILLSIEILNEGIDVPEVNLLCFARVTHSRRIFLQQLGRGLRITDNKKKVKVLDFVADIRRISEAIEINEESRARIKDMEVVNYKEGNIINFTTHSEGLFKEFLIDISDLDENSHYLQ